VDELVDRTDGVPLFVEELTKAVLESAAAHPGTHAIPATLQDSLMARLDRLDGAKELAQIGAVLGREFPYELLRAVSEREAAALEDDLERLEAAELLFRRGAPPHASYVFKHTLVQDAAYQSLFKARRRELHGRTARVLEEHFPDVRDTHPELLAHHFAEAGLEAEAVDYYGLSGTRAHERSAYDEAAAHLERGLELLASLPATPERAERELAMQLALGLALQVSKGLGDPDVERAFLRARELCRKGGEVRELFPALWGLWLYNMQGHSYRTADRLAEELLRLAETTREPGLLLQAHHAGWNTAQIRGSLRAAREHVLAGLAIYRPEAHHAQTHRFGNHDPGVCGLFNDAWMLALLGHPGQSTKRLEEALALAESLGHPFTRIICRVFAIFITLTLRDPPRVIAHIGGLTAELEALGGLPEKPTPQAVWLQGWGLLQGGRTAEGCARMREGVDAMLALGEPFLLPLALAILCEANAAEGRPDKGLELLAKSRSQIDAMGGNYYEPELHRVRGELLHARADGGERAAEAAFREALEVARRQHARLLELRAATSLARLWQQQGRKDEARELLAPVYDWFTEGFDTRDLKEAKALLDELEA
jgi:predicted ATPase